VDIVKSRDYVDMSNYVTNGEWSFVGTRIVRNEVRYPIGPAVYPDVSVYVTMRRRILYYMLNIILAVCSSRNLSGVVQERVSDLTMLHVLNIILRCVLFSGLTIR